MVITLVIQSRLKQRQAAAAPTKRKNLSLFKLEKQCALNKTNKRPILTMFSYSPVIKSVIKIDLR